MLVFILPKNLSKYIAEEGAERLSEPGNQGVCS